MAAVYLPPEIIASMVGYLAADRDHGLAPYATISRDWQSQVEQRTFSTLVLTPARLATALGSPTLLPGAGEVETEAEAEATQVRCRRWSAVRNVYVEAVLPPYGDEVRDRVEDDDDRAANNAAFSQAVHDAFRLLARGVGAHGFAADAEVTLNVHAVCPSDITHPTDYLNRLRDRVYGRTGDLLEARHQSSYLELVGVATLPPLPMVTAFDFDNMRGNTARRIAPAVCTAIASRLPRLRTVSWAFFDDEKRDVAGRRARRAAFAAAVPHMPSSVDDVTLMFCYSVADERFMHPVPLLPGDSSEADPLSVALGRWARRCKSFEVDASLTDDFWKALAGEDSGSDKNNDNNDNNDTPRTTMLRVLLTLVSPTGQWQAVRVPPEDGEPDNDANSTGGRLYPASSSSGASLPAYVPAREDRNDGHNRVCPKPDRWNAILRAAGGAVAALPALQRLELGLGGDWSACAAQVRYDVRGRVLWFASHPYVPESRCALSLVPRSSRRPSWAAHLFDPEPAVALTWRAASAAQLGRAAQLQVKLAHVGSIPFLIECPSPPPEAA